MDRRQFLAVATAATTAAMGENTMHAAPKANGIHIDEPFHGAVLHARLGQAVPGGLKIQVNGTAPAGVQVTVQGQPARRSGDRFLGEAVLRDDETDIVAAAQGPGQPSQHRVRVVWDRKSVKRYRFSIDDNSFFLRDIFQKGYKSLFDCFYLSGLRELNRKYGSKFVLNIYYTTGDDFKLPQFSDRYRSEWRDNAEWLRLAFHAYANDPDRPYQDAEPSKLIADLDLVAGEIRRFAGPEVYTPPTVIHWGMTRPSAFKPLYEHGVRVLSGYFAYGGKYDVNYRLDDARSEWLSHHDALKDFDSGIVFSRVDVVCNSVVLEKIVPQLREIADDPLRGEILDLFTHEQYFWPFYKRYVPDHFQRLDAALRFATERGYKPVFFHEGFLGV